MEALVFGQELFGLGFELVDLLAERDRPTQLLREGSDQAGLLLDGPLTALDLADLARDELAQVLGAESG